MYLYTVEALERYGYSQYEISNFARSGAQSKHNLKYWQLKDYIGFGASAASSLGNQRYTYLDNPLSFIEAVQSGGDLIKEYEVLSNYDRAAEYLMLNLRTTNGISENEYRDIYRCNFAPIDELLKSYADKGWAKFNGSRWCLTPRGFLLSNRLIGEILDTQAEQKLAAGVPWIKNDLYQDHMEGF